MTELKDCVEKVPEDLLSGDDIYFLPGNRRLVQAQGTDHFREFENALCCPLVEEEGKSGMILIMDRFGKSVCSRWDKG